jgi:S-adenosylmethionine decarboxylase
MNRPQMNPLEPAVGRHMLADLYGVQPARLQDGAALESLLRRAAEAAGAQVLQSHFHAFGLAGGITGVVLLAESHISIHTWPETGFVAADIFMCGAADPTRALAVLLEALSPSRRHVETVPRGFNGVSGVRRNP